MTYYKIQVFVYFPFGFVDFIDTNNVLCAMSLC